MDITKERERLLQEQAEIEQKRKALDERLAALERAEGMELRAYDSGEGFSVKMVGWGGDAHSHIGFIDLRRTDDRAYLEMRLKEAAKRAIILAALNPQLAWDFAVANGEAVPEAEDGGPIAIEPAPPPSPSASPSAWHLNLDAAPERDIPNTGLGYGDGV